MPSRQFEVTAAAKARPAAARQAEAPESAVESGRSPRVAMSASGDPRAQAASLAQASGGRLARAGGALLQLQHDYGNRHVQRLMERARAAPVIQTKLILGPADDRYEREADRVARQVASGAGGPALDAASRAPAIQRLASAEGGAVDAGVQQAIQQARGGGQPLPDHVRGSMEQALGADFSGVRLHSDARADQLNRSLQARAFTTGQDIFFRRGVYGGGSRGERELLAHELTHVVQQGELRTERDEIRAKKLERGKLNVVGEKHKESKKRRPAEAAIAKREVVGTEAPGQTYYWIENQFLAEGASTTDKKAAEGVEGKEKPEAGEREARYADPLHMRIVHLVHMMADEVQRDWQRDASVYEDLKTAAEKEEQEAKESLWGKIERGVAKLLEKPDEGGIKFESSEPTKLNAGDIKLIKGHLEFGLKQTDQMRIAYGMLQMNKEMEDLTPKQKAQLKKVETARAEMTENMRALKARCDEMSKRELTLTESASMTLGIGLEMSKRELTFAESANISGGMKILSKDLGHMVKWADEIIGIKQSGGRDRLPIDPTDFTRLRRSEQMDKAARKRHDVAGVWKIGDQHVKDLRLDKEPRPYADLTREEFNKEYASEIEIESKQASTGK